MYIIVQQISRSSEEMKVFRGKEIEKIVVGEGRSMVGIERPS